MFASRNPKDIGKLFGNASLIKLVMSVLVIIGCFLMFEFIQNGDKDSIVLILIGSLICALSNPLIVSYYRVVDEHLVPWLIYMLAPIIFLAYLYFSDSSDFFLIDAAWAYLVSQSITFIVFLIDLLRRVKLSFDFSLVVKHFKLGIMFSVSQSFDYASHKMDVIIIKLLLGANSLGVYSAGLKVVLLFNIIPSSFHIVELPEFHRLSRDKNKLLNRFIDLRLLLIEIGCLLTIGLFINSDLIIDLLYKEDYEYASVILEILSFSLILFFINYPYYMLAEAIGKVKERMNIRIITFIITLIFIFLGIEIWGIIGAPLALIGGQAIFLIFLHGLTKDFNGGILKAVKDFGVILIAVLILGMIKVILMFAGIDNSILHSIVFLVIFLGIGFKYDILKGSRKLLLGLLKWNY